MESEEEYDAQEIDKPALRNMPAGSEAVVDVVGELNLFDARTNLFMTQAGDVRCRLVRDGKFSCECQCHGFFRDHFFFMFTNNFECLTSK